MIGPVVRETLGRQVLRRLREYLVARGRGTGDRLPTEARTGGDAGRQLIGRPSQDHRKIIEALRAGNVSQTQRLMEAHLDQDLRWGIMPAPDHPAPTHRASAAHPKERRLS